MVHRGPDDEGFEQRPLGGADTATADCLIFNGEISNVRSLQTRLHAEGIEVRSSGDTEVLLKALSLWGERALEH
jgi:asparagine synthetase B (glutamine-hydrolysing)